MIKGGCFKDSGSSLWCLLEIRNQLFEWAELLPPMYRYNRLAFNVCENFPLGYYLTYSEFWIASIWNTYRCTSLLVNELILDLFNADANQHPLESPSTYAADKRLAQDCMDTAVSDICATVPFYLGWDQNAGVSDLSVGRPSAGICESLIWPLYLAASVTHSSEQKEWIVSQLDYIGCLIGNQQATTFANILRTGGDVSSWA